MGATTHYRCRHPDCAKIRLVTLYIDEAVPVATGQFSYVCPECGQPVRFDLAGHRAADRMPEDAILAARISGHT
jgi:hypothetical protein